MQQSCATESWLHYTDVGIAHDPIQKKLRLVTGILHMQGGFARYCLQDADCPGGQHCDAGACTAASTSCKVWPDVALNRLYLVPN